MVARDRYNHFVRDRRDIKPAVIRGGHNVLPRRINRVDRTIFKLSGILAHVLALRSDGNGIKVRIFRRAGKSGHALFKTIINDLITVRGQFYILIIVENDFVISRANGNGLAVVGYGGITLNRRGAFGHRRIVGLLIHRLAVRNRRSRAVPVIVNRIAQVSPLRVRHRHFHIIRRHRARHSQLVGGIARNSRRRHTIRRARSKRFGMVVGSFAAILVHIVNGQLKLCLHIVQLQHNLPVVLFDGNGLHNLITVFGMIVLIASNSFLLRVRINGLADLLAEHILGKFLPVLIMLNSNLHGLIRRIRKGNHVVVRITGKRQRLNRRLDGVIHNAINLDRRGGDLGHGHDGAADVRFLRGHQFLRLVAREHIADGILRRRAARIIEGNDVFLAYGKFDGLGRRIDAVAGNGKRVSRDLLILREAGAGDRLGGRKFLLRARFHIPNRIGKRVHFPMSVNGHIVGDRLIFIELRVAGLRRVPAGEGIAVTGRDRKAADLLAVRNGNSGRAVNRAADKFQSNRALRHRPIRIQRQTCRHLIIAAIMRRVIRIGIPALKNRTIHRLGNLSSIKNRFEVRVILDLLRRNQRTFLIVQIQLIFFRSIVEMNLLLIGCTCSKAAAFIVPFIVTDNLIKIGPIIKIVKLDIHRLVKAIGDAIPRFRFYSISCLIRIVILKPVMQSLRFIRRKSICIYRLVSGRHRIDSYKFIIIVASEVPCTGFSINCNRIKRVLPKLRDIRTILCSQRFPAITSAY